MMTNFKELIEDKLHSLVGLPLTDGSRAANMQCFHFGQKCTRLSRKGETVTVSKFALHVQCRWRIVGREGIIVGARDMYYPAGDPDDPPDEFDWDKPGANRCDERMKQFFQKHKTPLLVEEIEADITGGLRVQLQGGFRLEIFIDDSLNDEHWRFFEPGIDSAHLVVTGQGILD